MFSFSNVDCPILKNANVEMDGNGISNFYKAKLKNLRMLNCKVVLIGLIVGIYKIV